MSCQAGDLGTRPRSRQSGVCATDSCSAEYYTIVYYVKHSKTISADSRGDLT